MTDLANAGRLARYNAWSNKVMFDAVAALPAGEATKERKTLFKTMVGTLNHNLVVGLIFQAHLERREHGFKARNVVVQAELEALRAAQSSLDAWFIDWTGKQTDASLGETMSFAFVNGTPATMSRLDMLQHVVTHNSYPRGWVAEQFFAVPARPPQMDLTVYLCEAGGR